MWQSLSCTVTAISTGLQSSDVMILYHGCSLTATCSSTTVYCNGEICLKINIIGETVAAVVLLHTWLLIV